MIKRNQSLCNISSMWRQNILKNASSIYFPLCPPTISKLARGQSDNQSEERRKKEKEKKFPAEKKSSLSLSLGTKGGGRENRRRPFIRYREPALLHATHDPSWRRLCVVCTTACPLYDIKFLPSPRDKIFRAESRVLPWDLITD